MLAALETNRLSVFLVPVKKNDQAYNCLIHFYKRKMPQNVCRYYKFGYCKFVDKCRNLHVEEKCENKECDITKCDKRHPRPCTFYRDYGRCKYSDYCKYEHVHQENNILTEKFECRLDKLEKVIDEKILLLENLKGKLKRTMTDLMCVRKSLIAKKTQSKKCLKNLHSSMKSLTHLKALLMKKSKLLKLK